MNNIGTTTNILLGEEPTTIIIDAATTDSVARSLDLTDPRTRAKAAFDANPGKCFQHYLCEARGELEEKPKITKPIKDAQVNLIPNQQAAEIIKKYEYLATMATATRASYGLFLDNELLGVACFAAGTGSPESLRLTDCPASPILLARGVCLPHAPAHAASFLIRRACKMAHQQFGWDAIIAYSDPAAGEIGTIYQALGWRFIGWPKQGIKKSFISPDGKTLISSYAFNRKSEHKFVALGWDTIEPKYSFLRRLGFAERTESIKGKYVWFEGKRRKQLEKSCRFPALPYPKRQLVPDTGGEVADPSSTKKPIHRVGCDAVGEVVQIAGD